MKKLVILFIVTIFTCDVHAGKCSAMISKGWWKNYSILGIGLDATTKPSSVGGSSSFIGTTKTTGQTLTSILDPGITSNFGTSTSQTLSSWGECALVASAGDLRQLRELYYAQNKEGIIKELAIGQGEHLEVMSFFGRCNMDAQLEFNQTMQKNFGALLPHSESTTKFMDQFDGVLKDQLNCNLG